MKRAGKNRIVTINDNIGAIIHMNLRKEAWRWGIDCHQGTVSYLITGVFQYHIDSDNASVITWLAPYINGILIGRIVYEIKGIYKKSFTIRNIFKNIF